MIDRSLLDRIVDACPGVSEIERLVANIEEHKGLTPTWHPLGFVHAQLASFADSMYRIHIWPNRERRPKTPNWPIHNHVFDLRSRVLAGVITDRRYELQRNELGEMDLYRVVYVPNGSQIVSTNKSVTLDLAHERTYSKWQGYEVLRGEFHASDVPLDVESVTLVRTSNHLDESPQVVGNSRESRVTSRYERQPVKMNRFMEYLHRTLLDI